MIWLIPAAVLIAAVLCICLYTFRTCYYSPKNRTEDPYSLLNGEQYEAVKEVIFACTRRMDETPCQWVSTTSFDGLKLAARYYHTRDGAPLMILFHGYRSMALRDCAGGFGLAKKLGFNVLVADHRAHARSEGTVISFGINERRDCLTWIEYANSRFGSGTPIVLSGLSMGAATVLMASELPLADNVCCIMADCPYSSPSAIIRRVCREDRGMPDKLVYPFIWLSAIVFGRFRLTESSAVQAVKNAGIPILLLHGEDDRFVPCEMSREIYDSAPDKIRLETFPGAGHGLCYMMDHERYHQVTVQFMNTIPALQEHLSHNAFAQEELNKHG